MVGDGVRIHLVLQARRVKLHLRILRINLPKALIERVRAASRVIQPRLVSRRRECLRRAMHMADNRLVRTLKQVHLDKAHDVRAERHIHKRGERKVEICDNRAERKCLEGKARLVRAVVRVVLPLGEADSRALVECKEARDEGHKQHHRREPNMLVSRPAVEVGHEGLEDEEAREQRAENAREEEDDRHASGGAQLACERRGALDVLRTPALDAEGPTGGPTHGEDALTDAPPLNECDRPQAKRR